MRESTNGNESVPRANRIHRISYYSLCCLRTLVQQDGREEIFYIMLTWTKPSQVDLVTTNAEKISWLPPFSTMILHVGNASDLRLRWQLTGRKSAAGQCVDISEKNPRILQYRVKIHVWLHK